MATITPFPHQNIPIMTEFSLDIAVSGDPEDISVDGRLKGFYYNWTGTHIQLRGTPSVYAENIEITITADDASYTGTFSIVPVAPVIGELETRSVSRGVELAINIPITGHVSDLVIRGPWIGLKYKITDTGGMMYGTIPADANFTARSFVYNITAYNANVFDSATLTLNAA